MSRSLLDTNVVSELRKRDRADPHVREWLNDNVDAELLSALVVAELRRGVELINRRDPASGAALRAWLEHVVLAAALEPCGALHSASNVDAYAPTGQC